MRPLATVPGLRWAHPGRGALCAALLCLGLSWPASSASAWTRSTVESASAHLDLQEDGSALVLLEVELRVRGGWLSDFELVGLGEGAVLDADKQPWLVGEDGRKYVPDARMRDGRLQISFSHRRRAPWRGRYRIGVLYRVPPAATGEAGRLHFALPAWRVDMQNVVVRVEGPRGLELLNAGTENLDVSRSVRGQRVHLRITRAQLPRTLRWELDFNLPTAGASTASPPSGGAGTTRAAPPFSVEGLAAGVLLALLAWLKRGFTRRRYAQRGAVALPLLWTGPAALGTTLMLTTGIAAGLLHQAHPGAALGLLMLTAALGLSRGQRPVGPADEGVHGRRTAAPVDFQRARSARRDALYGQAAWLDATTPMGGTLLASSAGLVLLSLHARGEAGLWLEVWMLALPIFLNGSRLTAPAGGTQELLRLSDIGRTLRGMGGRRSALALTVDAAPTRTTAPALEVYLRSAPAGLRRLELQIGRGDWQGREREQPMWVAITDADSPADARLAHALPAAQPITSRDGTRIARFVPALDPTQELESLLEWLSQADRPPSVSKAA